MRRVSKAVALSAMAVGAAELIAPAVHADVVTGDVDAYFTVQDGNNAGASLFTLSYGGVACGFCVRPTTVSQLYYGATGYVSPSVFRDGRWKFKSSPDLTARYVGDIQPFISSSGVMTTCDAHYETYAAIWHLNQNGYANALPTINPNVSGYLQNGWIGLNSSYDSTRCDASGTSVGWDAIRVYY